MATTGSANSSPGPGKSTVLRGFGWFPGPLYFLSAMTFLSAHLTGGAGGQSWKFHEPCQRQPNLDQLAAVEC